MKRNFENYSIFVRTLFVPMILLVLGGVLILPFSFLTLVGLLSMYFGIMGLFDKVLLP